MALLPQLISRGFMRLQQNQLFAPPVRDVRDPSLVGACSQRGRSPRAPDASASDGPAQPQYRSARAEDVGPSIAAAVSSARALRRGLSAGTRRIPDDRRIRGVTGRRHRDAGLRPRDEDFSEDERDLLNLLRPHLRQAYANADAMTTFQSQLEGREQALEEAVNTAVVVVHDMAIRHASVSQRDGWRASSPTEARNDELPDLLQRWSVSGKPRWRANIPISSRAPR